MKKAWDSSSVEELNRVIKVDKDMVQAFLSLEQACKYLGVGKTYFKEEVEPQIPRFKFGRSNKYKIKDLDTWAENQRAS
jgi:excisionase family DNA binding protein